MVGYCMLNIFYVSDETVCKQNSTYINLLSEGNQHLYSTDRNAQAEGHPNLGSSNSKPPVPFHEPGISRFRLENLWPFGFQEATCLGNLQLLHALHPSPGFLWPMVRVSWKELTVGAMGTPQLLC